MPQTPPKSPKSVKDIPQGAKSPRNKIPQQRPAEEMLLAAIRLSVREELREMISEEGDFREMLRIELADSLREAMPSSVHPLHDHEHLIAEHRGVVEQDVSPDSATRSLAAEAIDWNLDAPQEEDPTAEGEGANKHFSDFLKTMTIADPQSHHGASASSHQLDPMFRGHPLKSLFIKLDMLYFWLMQFHEPRREGFLASIITSSLFESLVCTVILTNCAFMVYAADTAVSNPEEAAKLWAPSAIGEWFFQIFYSVELTLKFIVHRQYFFINDHWRLNWFDLVLVTAGYADLLLGEANGGTFLRVLRLVKLGKAMRAVKIMAQLRHLRAFLVCLQGSFMSFVWSLVMLLSVFFLFSLFFVQGAATYIAETGQALDGPLEVHFGSVSQSMLTLYMASTGGDDWSKAFYVISEVGTSASIVYLIFIAFVQLALINIITGMFVESAMQTLAPDRETIALAHQCQEQEYAKDLEHLCKLVDSDFSGKLTPEQFQEGMRKGRIPTLLMLLGLSKHHVLQFFQTMSDLAADDDGQVDIRHFVAGCMRLKGAATNFDLQLLHAEVKCIQLAQQRSLNVITQQLNRLCDDNPRRVASKMRASGASEQAGRDGW